MVRVCARRLFLFFVRLCCSLSSPRFCSCMCDPRAFVVYVLQVSPLFSAVGVASPSRQILGMLCTTFRRAPHGKACLCLHPKNVLSRWRAVSCGVPCPDSRVGKTFLSIFCDDSGESWRCGTTDVVLLSLHYVQALMNLGDVADLASLVSVGHGLAWEVTRVISDCAFSCSCVNEKGHASGNRE